MFYYNIITLVTQYIDVLGGGIVEYYQFLDKFISMENKK